MIRKLSFSAVAVFAVLAPVYAQTPAPNTPGAATTANPELQKQLTPTSCTEAKAS
jgi:hypothetical protein